MMKKISFKLSKWKMDQRGFSLIEILMAVGVGGVVLAGVTYLFVSSKKQEVLFTVKEDASSFSQELSAVMKGTACGIARLSLPGSTIPLNDPQFFNNPANTIDLPDGLVSDQLSIRSAQIYGKVKVRSVQIGPRQIATAATPSYEYVIKNPQLVLGQIVVRLDNFTGTNSEDSRNHEARQDVFLHLDSSGQEIVNCVTLEQVTVMQEGCDAFGGDWDMERMTCSLKNSSPSGEATTCPFNDECSADEQYKL